MGNTGSTVFQQNGRCTDPGIHRDGSRCDCYCCYSQDLGSWRPRIQARSAATADEPVGCACSTARSVREARVELGSGCRDHHRC